MVTQLSRLDRSKTQDFSRPETALNPRSGFTMVEITIAIIILVMGILPLYQVFINSSRDARRNRNRAYAAALAACVLERYRGTLDWSNPQDALGKLFNAFPRKGAVTAELDKKQTRHEGKSLPEFLDDDYLVTPWETKNRPPDVNDTGYFKEYRDLISKNQYRRLAYFEKVNDRVGQLVCYVVWREQGTAPGTSQGGTSGSGYVDAQYSIGVLIADPIFPAGHSSEPWGN